MAAEIESSIRVANKLGGHSNMGNNWGGLKPPAMSGIASPVKGGKGTKGPLGSPTTKNPIGAYKLGRKTKTKKLKAILG